ncbi:hypothetical protein HNQ07_000282 [Deinococcus metalli]|uniref:Uncharacterized protein n=1 Tax=Deinococcus metalli TaxID=1141878 RepID=A0A7W8NPH7_9DEIO|nr:hypothetical protein [Deinococcus metalli]MBB5374838.1 hypothetical protein [Deinococcus metalli]GHF33325.1 hypothetical protein GCM10017781_07600 [Deinococcus metalli]
MPSVRPGNGPETGAPRTTMLALVYILCERRPRAPAVGEWEAEARFLLPTPTAFLEALETAGLADRGHPTDLGVQVSTDILFEDGDITGQTVVHPAELLSLAAHVDDATRVRVHAWHAFAQALEHDGQDARLVIWFIR